LIGLGVSVLVGYSVWQARLLIIGPSITLSEVPTFVQTERIVTLTGYAANITTITLNGRKIYTDLNGYFAEGFLLENGYTIATLEGTDRYGRTTRVIQDFIYSP